MTAREELTFEPIVPGQGLGPVFGAAAAAATTAIVAAVIASAVAAVPGWAAASAS